MKVTRVKDGARLRFNLPESHVVEQMFAELRDTLEPGALAADDPVRRRLYPDGYADSDAASEFRELTESSLSAERGERVETCLAEVRAHRSTLRTDLTLDADGADRWMRVLNDLRLTYGTRLGIADDEDYSLRPGDLQAPLRARYLFLTALQDLLVTALID